MRKLNLRKIDLSNSLKNKIGLPLSISKKIVEDLLQISSEILKEKNLIIKNIGTLKVINKNKRYGRNPKTKQIFVIKERRSVSFTVSKNFTKKING